MTTILHPAEASFAEDIESYVYQQCILSIDRLPESYFRDLIIEKTISKVSFTVRVQDVSTAKLIVHKSLLLIYNVD